MRRLPLALLSALTVGCFSPEAPPESEGSGDASNTGTDSGPTSDTESGTSMGSGPEGSTDTDMPTSMGSETDTSDPTGSGGDAPPLFETFEVNGSTTPDDVTHSSMVQLTATVSDDVGIASVAFYDGDMLLGTVTEAPFGFDTLVTSMDFGGHVFRAVATDSANQESESDEVQLLVDVNGGELIDVNEGLFQGCESLFGFGGIARIRDDRFVLAGTGCLESDGETPDAPNILAFDDDLDVLSQVAVSEAMVATPPTGLDDGRVLVPTWTADQQNSTWNYHVFDPQLGEIDPGSGLVYAQLSSFNMPAAVSLVGRGVFLVRAENEAALLEPDLDSPIWTNDLGVGAGGSANVRALTVGGDGSIFVLMDTSDCPGAAEQCLAKLTPDGAREWTRAVQDPPYFGGLAPDGTNGVFYALRAPTGLGYLVAHLNSEGDEVSSELISFDRPSSAFARLAPDGQGGVVLAGAYGDQDPNTAGQVSNDQSFLLRLDESLEEAWRVEDFGPGQSRAVALSPDGTGSLIVAGIRATAAPPTLLGITGPVWLGRVDL